MGTLSAKGNMSEKRDEIVRQAYEVFYKMGFHASGVDSLLKGTGISKRTLYKHFESKEDLIHATILHYQETLLKSILDFVNKKPGRTPSEKILLIFDWLENLTESGNLLGCYAIKAKLEYVEKEKAIEKACDSHFSNIENALIDFCREAKVKDPKKTAHQIQILFQGAIINSQITRDVQSARHAKTAAKTILENAI